MATDRFIRSFTGQWLMLNEIDATSPNTDQFPTYDPIVHESIVQETRAFVTELVCKDLGVTQLIDSDFLFVNGRLGRHYFAEEFRGRRASSSRSPDTADRPKTTIKIPPGLTLGFGLQKIPRPPDSSRGGLLTQAAIMKVTADGSTTSPVLRGVFVNERILGTHDPPPPTGVPAIEPDVRGAVTIRDQLGKHRSSESCWSCHRIIDPPGLVLENFDPVGKWRSRYAGGTGTPVDSTCLTPDGKSFTDIASWKKIYRHRSDLLAKNFAEQFLTYATGAAIRFSDEAVVDQIVKDSQSNDHGLRSIIRSSITSRIFLEK